MDEIECNAYFAACWADDETLRNVDEWEWYLAVGLWETFAWLDDDDVAGVGDGWDLVDG